MPKVNIEATTTAMETFTGAEVSGQVTYVYGGNEITVNAGEKATITEIEQGQTASVKIILKADNYVERIIKEEPMTGTHEYTIDLKDKTGFDWEGFVNEITRYNLIKRLQPPADGRLNMCFNPDYAGTGKRLPDNWINETIRVWDKIKNNSNGKITYIEYLRDGNKTRDDLVGEGEVYVFHDSNNTGISNGTFTRSDGSVYGIILRFNSDMASLNRAEGEIIDSLFEGEQNIGHAWDWVKFAFKRPAGDKNGYRIYSTHEEQNTVDEYCGTANYLGQTVITKPIFRIGNPLDSINPFHNPDNDLEETFHPAKPVERRTRDKALGTKKGTERNKR